MLKTVIFFHFVIIVPKKSSSVYVIIRLMLSINLCPKVIILSGFFCSRNKCTKINPHGPLNYFENTQPFHRPYMYICILTL
jgi:hypothetical protein